MILTVLLACLQTIVYLPIIQKNVVTSSRLCPVGCQVPRWRLFVNYLPKTQQCSSVSRLASRPTAPKRPLPSATSRTCSRDKRPSSNTRPATLVGIRSTSSWPSTRRAEAPQPFRFARFFKMPTASCTCAYACTQTQTNSNPFTPPFAYPPPLQDPCPWAPRATTHTMCTRAPRAHRGFAPCQPQTRECTSEAPAS